MRLFPSLLLLALAAAPAAAQAPSPAPPSAVLDAMRRHFPVDHATLTAGMAGKAPEEARRIAFSAIERFVALRSRAILAAPGAAVVALEARQAALLRTIEKTNVRACAAVGDKGFFGEAALTAGDLPGLEAYGVALVEAAKAGEIGGPPPAPATAEDLTAWMREVDRLAPGIPFRTLLSDPAARAAAPPEQLCRGAAAMHEAVARLPAGPAERVARLLLKAVITRGR